MPTPDALLRMFTRPWCQAPMVWIDTETTGVEPGTDRAVEVALVRFEGGGPVGEFSALVNPHRPISEGAAAVHGITDAEVADAPSIQSVFLLTEVQRLVRDAQPAAYNAPFDRHFVPPFGDDWTWPWLDALSLVRASDRFVRGKGRHRLAVTCERHGIAVGAAHEAASDARAAGMLFHKLAMEQFGSAATLGTVLRWQRQQEAEEWFRFNEWLSKQPPKEVADGSHG
jgi:DNA polymerase III epsilon subunit-like protein